MARGRRSISSACSRSPAGYHRYFSHRSYRLKRVPQFVLAFVGTTAAQKGPLWWAAHHRAHHKYSDTERDIHSPIRGFWWSHVGWILCDKYNETDSDAIKDFTKYPELVWLDKHDWIGPWALGIACYLYRRVERAASSASSRRRSCCGTPRSCVNSLAHVFGRRVYDTPDTSRNSLIVALITSGEGWHNNHHRYPWAARQGFRWWQIDVTYYVLRLFSFVGIVRDLRPVPVAVRDEARALPLSVLNPAPRRPRITGHDETQAHGSRVGRDRCGDARRLRQQVDVAFDGQPAGRHAGAHDRRRPRRARAAAGTATDGP